MSKITHNKRVMSSGSLVVGKAGYGGLTYARLSTSSSSLKQEIFFIVYLYIGVYHCHNYSKCSSLNELAFLAS